MKTLLALLSLVFLLQANETVCDNGEKACLVVEDEKTHRTMYLVNMNDYPIWVQRAAVRINDQTVNIDGRTFEANSKTELIREKRRYFKFGKNLEKDMHIVKWMYYGTVDKKTFGQ